MRDERTHNISQLERHSVLFTPLPKPLIPQNCYCKTPGKMYPVLWVMTRPHLQTVSRSIVLHEAENLCNNSRSRTRI